MQISLTLFNYYDIHTSYEFKKNLIHDWVYEKNAEAFKRKYNPVNSKNNIVYSSEITKDIIINNLHDDVKFYLMKSFMIEYIYNEEFEFLYKSMNMTPNEVKDCAFYVCACEIEVKLNQKSEWFNKLFEQKYDLEVDSLEDNIINQIIEEIDAQVETAMSYIRNFLTYYDSYIINKKDFIINIVQDVSFAVVDGDNLYYTFSEAFIDAVNNEYSLNLNLPEFIT